MRCVTRNEANTELDWVVSVSAVTYLRVFSGYVLLPMEMSNNLRVVIWCILLSIKKIWWADKCRLCEKVGNLTFALSANWLWINAFVCCANFRLFGGLVSVSAVKYWRVFSGSVLLPMEMSRTDYHGNKRNSNSGACSKIVQPACRDLEYIIECQEDMMSGQMQVMWKSG